MKRAISVCSAFVLLFGVSCMFSACGGGENYSETYTGTLSEETYTTKQAAADGFVGAELNGDVATCSFLEFIPDRVLDETETAELLGESAQSVTEAEYGKVRYSVSGGENEQLPLYVCNSEEGYRYFTPRPENGARLTRSYYRSVMENGAYSNCTVETTYSMQLMSLSALHYQLLKFDTDKAYFKQDLPGAYNVDFYLAENTNGFRIYTKHPENNDGKYYDFDRFKDRYEFVLQKGGRTYPITSFTDISDLSSFMFAADFDSSYFEKTSYGFYIPTRNYKKLIEDMLLGASDELEEFRSDWDEHKMFMEAKYYVTEGRLSQTTVQLTACDGENVFAVSVKSQFHSFGSTSIDLPEVEA